MISKRDCISVLLVTLLLFSFSSFSFSQEFKVKISKSGAVIKKAPSNDSETIMEVPFIGAELGYESQVGEWIQVSLPPDKDGNVLIGYINSFFVDVIKVNPPVREQIPPPQKVEYQQNTIQQQDGFSEWQNKLARVKNKASIGMALTVMGIATLGAGLYFTFATKEDESGYRDHIHYMDTSGNALIVIADAVGAATMISGIVLLSSSNVQRESLEEERKLKGYVGAGLLAKYRALGVQLGIAF